MVLCVNYYHLHCCVIFIRFIVIAILFSVSVRFTSLVPLVLFFWFSFYAVLFFDYSSLYGLIISILCFFILFFSFAVTHLSLFTFLQCLFFPSSCSLLPRLSLTHIHPILPFPSSSPIQSSFPAQPITSLSFPLRLSLFFPSYHFFCHFLAPFAFPPVILAPVRTVFLLFFPPVQ